MYIVNQKINGKCDSCPFNGQIDNKHKLTSHIVRNPPNYKPQVIKATKIIEKQTKNEEKAYKNNDENTNSTKK